MAVCQRQEPKDLQTEPEDLAAPGAELRLISTVDGSLLAARLGRRAGDPSGMRTLSVARTLLAWMWFHEVCGLVALSERG